MSSEVNDDVPPLAIYHVCRICLRPRSARYHREHPIPVDGVPPPPGICRKCRVSTVEELNRVTQVQEEHRSGDVKLGLKCLVPDSDYFTNSEMRSRRAEHVLSEAEWKELEPPRLQTPHQSHKESEACRRPTGLQIPPPPPVPPLPPTYPAQGRPAQPPAPPQVKRVQKETLRDTLQGGKADVVEMPRLCAVNDSEVSSASLSSNSRRRSSIHYASVSERTYRSARTESDIRRLARDEVERYRQAERKMEAHGRVYAHGRLVPLERRATERVPAERRIEQQADVVEVKPWTRGQEGTRRDSAFAMHGGIRKEANRSTREAQEMTIGLQTLQNSGKERSLNPNVATRGSKYPSSPPSDLSDKTRWPGAKHTRRSHVPQQPLPTDTKDKEYAAVEQLYGPVKEMGAKQLPQVSGYRHQVYEVVDDEEVRHQHSSSRIPPELLAREKAERQAQLDREKPGREAEMAREKAEDKADLTEDSGRAVQRCNAGGKLQPNGPSDHANRHRSGQRYVGAGDDFDGRFKDVSYRQERDGDASAKVLKCPLVVLHDEQLPLRGNMPESHRRQPDASAHGTERNVSPTKKDFLPDGDREYYYVRRTVTPVNEPPESAIFEDQPDDYYKEVTETVQRRRAPGNPAKAVVVKQPERAQRRTSDVSSKVRFSTNVDFSPTPPASDASSTNFHGIDGHAKNHTDGVGPRPGADVTAANEPRGRARSRAPSHGYYYERDVYRAREHGYMPAGDVGRDATPRPPQPERRRSESTETTVLPSNLGRFAKVRSESPSREKLLQEARQRKTDGLPPYAPASRRSASVDAEDGSTISSSSSRDYHPREPVRHQARRGKR